MLIHGRKIKLIQFDSGHVTEGTACFVAAVRFKKTGLIKNHINYRGDNKKLTAIMITLNDCLNWKDNKQLTRVLGKYVERVSKCKRVGPNVFSERVKSFIRSENNDFEDNLDTLAGFMHDEHGKIKFSRLHRFMNHLLQGTC